ncbi:chorismate synthase [Phakopsora pachyrhizi]|uniref:Chorismate synthase n=1 Tax=Phakopsora pachyrhizi TaxID=170000 RepID=A0AAV0BCR9_PHAPC|nr:chorismate synthase [Phakopsora pachyrhizi]KAI8453764.1 chorismate synthase [Phakopsora pachyrhizi]CAH7685078.1 chorismate synthase [Phakopsora pachyrhizi]CAH7685085.1 chorismate synthase [Phakopsora pachyrhizi]
MSTFGTNFRVTTAGESHCLGITAIIDGVPPGLQLSEQDIQPQLSRRRPGQSDLTTPRNESDLVRINSGVEHGHTLGSPISIFVPNKDQRPHDYSEMDLYPRPSHADWTYLLKYGIKSSSGGGRSSARETIARVAAGAIAEKFLKTAFGVEIVAFVSGVGKIHLTSQSLKRGVEENGASNNSHEDEDGEDCCGPEYMEFLSSLTRSEVDESQVRCPHPAISAAMEKRVLKAKDAHDSIGGTVTCVIRNCPVGLGEPCFDKLEAKLAHAMMSIPATKGFEIGSGFRGAEIAGSQHNDMFEKKIDGSGLRTITNRSGGIQGGISNGENIYFRCAFKSPATIARAQPTATYGGEAGVLAAKGRHDPCVVPRAVPIVEAMAAITIMDAVLQQSARKSFSMLLPRPTSLPNSMKLPELHEKP